MNGLRVEQLCLRLGGRRILDSVSFSLEPGRFKLLIGPNGVGKTSLLKCVLGINRWDSGDIVWDGRPIKSIPARQLARNMAYVPQYLESRFTLDVYAFLELSRYAYEDESRAQRRRIIADCLQRTATEHLQTAYLDELSGGERQRVLLAAALAQQPRLLILDEPDHSLDPSHRVDMIRLLEELYRADSLSILLVTHDWNAYRHLNPEVLALKNGRISFECKAEDLDRHLEELFECRFHHLEVDGRRLSLPRYHT